MSNGIEAEVTGFEAAAAITCWPWRHKLPCCREEGRTGICGQLLAAENSPWLTAIQNITTQFYNPKILNSAKSSNKLGRGTQTSGEIADLANSRILGRWVTKLTQTWTPESQKPWHNKWELFSNNNFVVIYYKSTEIQ